MLERNRYREQPSPLPRLVLLALFFFGGVVLGQVLTGRVPADTGRELADYLAAAQPPVADAMNELRSFMFERVYCNPVAKSQEDKARAILQQLYHYYMTHPDRLPEHFRPQMDFDGMERTVCDYIAGMTDKYAIDQFSELFIPQGWQVR